MRTVDKIARVSRRGFLQRSAVAAIATGTIGTLTGATALAETFKTIEPDAAKTLVIMVRDLYPHDRLSDHYYESALAAIDTALAADKTTAGLLSEGAKALD